VFDLHLSAAYCIGCVVPLAKPGAAAAITAEVHLGHGNLLAARCRCAGLPVLAEAPRFRARPGQPPPRRCAGCCPPTSSCCNCGRQRRRRASGRTRTGRALAAFIAGPLGREVVEIGLAPRAVAAGEPGRRSLCGLLSLEESAAVIRRARLFVGIGQRAAAHLANAVGTPGIVLLGRFAGFARYMPLQRRLRKAASCRAGWADRPAGDAAAAAGAGRRSRAGCAAIVPQQIAG